MIFSNNCVINSHDVTVRKQDQGFWCLIIIITIKNKSTVLKLFQQFLGPGETYMRFSEPKRATDKPSTNLPSIYVMTVSCDMNRSPKGQNSHDFQYSNIIHYSA